VKSRVFHPEADAEYTRAVQYYAAIRPELGSRLYDEIERLIEEIRRQPERFFRFNPPAGAHWPASSLILLYTWIYGTGFGL
jgi:hypothetical protein